MDSYGFARVVVFIKNTLSYEQISGLQDDSVQSVWIKGGFQNGRKIYFCHLYREHTSTLGSSLADQRLYMDKLLHQWEAACSLNNLDDQNEIHIVGDINLDALGERWLSPGYSLLSLAKMVENVCNSFNLTQLVKEPTRKQFNSVDATTHQSCIDHIYTNVKHRCSNPEIISFGASDHDLISYSKEPPSQAKTVRKRSYKNFDA